MNANDIIRKYNLDKSTWTNKGFHGVLHTFFSAGEEAILPLKRHYGDCFHTTIVFFKENYVNWYWNDNDAKRLRESFIKKVNKSPKFLDQWVALWERLGKKFQKEYKRCEQDLAKLPDRKLLKLYKTFYDAYIEQYSVAIGIQDAFSMHADEFFVPLVRALLRKKGMEQNLDDVFITLTSPVTESFVATEYYERLKILKKIRQSRQLTQLFQNSKEEMIRKLERFPKVDTLLTAHAKKWFWLENNYAVQKVLGKEYFAEKLVNEMHLNTDPDEEIRKIQQRIPETKKQKRMLMKTLNIGSELSNLVSITEAFYYMQDERKKYVLMANHHIRRFFDEIGQRVGLTSQEMAYTAYPEVGDILLRKKFDKKKLAERKKHCVCIQTANRYEVFEGAVVDELFDAVFNPKVKEETLHGIAASKGVAKGVVKIVRKVHDLVNVFKGDILVASMTRPEMVVAMKKAAAIVTDEGGITSHAAIVSRELHIPCIVGTKNATKILKDGDLVEVDANKGIVRKL